MNMKKRIDQLGKISALRTIELDLAHLEVEGAKADLKSKQDKLTSSHDSLEVSFQEWRIMMQDNHLSPELSQKRTADIGRLMEGLQTAKCDVASAEKTANHKNSVLLRASLQKDISATTLKQAVKKKVHRDEEQRLHNTELSQLMKWGKT